MIAEFFLELLACATDGRYLSEWVNGEDFILFLQLCFL